MSSTRCGLTFERGETETLGDDPSESSESTGRGGTADVHRSPQPG